jgi:hypothetical protein
MNGWRNRLPILLCVLCMPACVCASPPACSAQATNLIVIPRPAASVGLSYFKLTARPGHHKLAGTIELRNPTARAQRVALAAVDGATLSTLGSTYLPRGGRPHGATRWLYIGRPTIALPAHGRAVVPVTIRVPRAARPGDYLSGVSIETLNQLSRPTARKGISIASVVRYAIGVEISLPGLRHPLIRFTGAGLRREPAGLTFLLDARNLGNVILQGVHGHVHVVRAGHTILSRPIEAGTFVAHTAIAYPVHALDQMPAEGTRYLVSAWMRYRGGIARLHETVVFGHRAAVQQQRYSTAHTPASGATPATAWWKIALLAGALLYGALVTILLWRRRSRETSAHDLELHSQLRPEP